MTAARTDHLRAVLPDESLDILLNADRVELLQLRPTRATADDTFHGFPVLARLPVAEAGRREALVTGLADAIERGAVPARCFIPHHGVRAERGDRAVDLVVCFACSRVLVIDSPDGEPRETSISNGPRQFIDWLFLESGLRLLDCDDGRCEDCQRQSLDDIAEEAASAPPVFRQLVPPIRPVVVHAVTRRCRRCSLTDTVLRPAPPSPE